MKNNFHEVIIKDLDLEVINNCINRLLYDKKDLDLIHRGTWLIKIYDLALKVKSDAEETIIKIYDYKTLCSYDSCIKINHKCIEYDVSCIYDTEYDISMELKQKLYFTNIVDQESLAKICSFTNLLFRYYGDLLPYTKQGIKKGKKSKVKKIYTISSDFIQNRLVVPELNNLSNVNLDELPNIYTSEASTKFLLDKYKEFNNEEVLVPFEDFCFKMGEDVKCRVKLLNDNMIGVMGYGSRKNVILRAIMYIDDIVNGVNFLGDVKDEYFDYFSYEEDTRDILCRICISILVNLYFFTRYSVKKKYISRGQNSSVNTSKNHSSGENQVGGKNYTLPSTKSVYIYSVLDTIKSENINKRKAPKYVKKQWSREGHYRYCKSGKKVWIKPTTCTRHSKIYKVANSYNIDYKKLKDFSSTE